MLMLLLGLGVAGLAVLTVLDLLLSLGLARRMRLGGGAGASVAIGMEGVGSLVEAFKARTLEGETVNEQSVSTGSTVVAFLSETCTACPPLKQEILKSPPRDDLLVVVYGPADEPGPETVQLRDRGRVVWAGMDETIRKAFHVTGYPTVFRVTNGVIAKGGLRLRDVELV